ncbi:MAG: hypothetical protein AAFP90_13170 [Planctomycetota bacterium]
MDSQHRKQTPGVAHQIRLAGPWMRSLWDAAQHRPFIAPRDDQPNSDVVRTQRVKWPDLDWLHGLSEDPSRPVSQETTSTDAVLLSRFRQHSGTKLAIQYSRKFNVPPTLAGRCPGDEEIAIALHPKSIAGQNSSSKTWDWTTGSLRVEVSGRRLEIRPSPSTRLETSANIGPIICPWRPDSEGYPAHADLQLTWIWQRVSSKILMASNEIRQLKSLLTGDVFLQIRTSGTGMG